MHPQITWIPGGDFQPLRYRPGGIGNWSGHLPFAADLVAAARPNLLVELGTHHGESYFGFCQAVAENAVACSCYAVDTWIGEEQAGSYDESVYDDVASYNDARYKDFSYLLRTTFDEAVQNFADDSIDLLHIDGLHTFEAVSHDFYNWLPKVKPGGIVLLHDVAARHGDFGVWKLWESLAGSGAQFLFSHSWGLGVYRKREPEGAATQVDNLFEADPRYQEHLRKFYALSALRLEREFFRTNAASTKGQVIGAEIFPRLGEDFSSDICYRVSFAAGQWQKIVVELSISFGQGPLRIDLAEQACLLDIASISLRKPVGQETIWAAVGADIATLPTGGDMSLFELPATKEFCRFLSTGSDPQLFIPAFDGSNLDQPLYLEMWVRCITDTGALLQIMKVAKRAQLSNEEASEPIVPQPMPEPLEAPPEIDAASRALSECNSALEEVRGNYARLAGELDVLSQEKLALTQSHKKLQSELYVTRVDLENAREVGNQLPGLVHARNLEAARRQQEVAELERTLHQITNSRSWRLTAALRSFKQRAR